MAIVTREITPTWKRVTFYYNHVLGDSATTLIATNSTGIVNIYDRDEQTIWQVDTAQTTVEIISYDLVNEITADYLAVGWHNFNTVGASIKFEHSADGATYTELISAFSPGSDETFIKEFDSTTDKYFKMTLTFPLNARPQSAMLLWGIKTELDYNLVGFEPNERTIKDIRHINNKGYLNAIKTRYTERGCRLSFKNLDSPVYANLTDWHTTIRRNQFFVGWENTNHSEDSFIMRSRDGKFMSPIGLNGRRKSANINLIGKV